MQAACAVGSLKYRRTGDKGGAKFIGGDFVENTATYEQANPREQSLHANSLLSQGDADPIVPATQASESEMPYAIVCGVGHFDRIHSDRVAFQVFLAELNKVFAK